MAVEQTSHANHFKTNLFVQGWTVWFLTFFGVSVAMHVTVSDVCMTGLNKFALLRLLLHKCTPNARRSILLCIETSAPDLREATLSFHGNMQLFRMMFHKKIWRSCDNTCGTCLNSLRKQCRFGEAKISSAFYPFLLCNKSKEHMREPLSLYYATMFKVHGQPFAGRRNAAVNDNGKIVDIVNVANGSET